MGLFDDAWKYVKESGQELVDIADIVTTRAGKSIEATYDEVTDYAKDNPGKAAALAVIQVGACFVPGGLMVRAGLSVANVVSTSYIAQEHRVESSVTVADKVIEKGTSEEFEKEGLLSIEAGSNNLATNEEMIAFAAKLKS